MHCSWNTVSDQRGGSQSTRQSSSSHLHPTWDCLVMGEPRADEALDAPQTTDGIATPTPGGPFAACLGSPVSFNVVWMH